MEYSKIIDLINLKKLDKALEFLKDKTDTVEKYNLTGYIYHLKKDYVKAKKNYLIGLNIETNDDLLFNYAHLLFEIGKELDAWRYLMRISKKDWSVYDLLGDIELKNRSNLLAINFYKKAYELNTTKEYFSKIIPLAQKFEQKKDKLVFLCLPNFDSFIKDIADILAFKYKIKIVTLMDKEEIKNAIKWADIVWLEWANEMAVFVTNNIDELKNKKVLCRLHSYEIFNSKHINNINWKIIDKLIFVSEHIRSLFFEMYENIFQKEHTHVIENGINLNKYTYKQHKHGYNIAIVAGISHKKNPAQWIQIISMLTKIDSRYKLHIAGKTTDNRYRIYLNYMIEELNLHNNVKFYGHIANINEFLDDKNYILSTSIHEGHPYNIMEAMAKGIKPIIHNYFGAKQQWPQEYIYNSINELKEQLTSNYNSEKCREFIEKNYTFELQIFKIERVLLELLNKKKINIINEFDNYSAVENKLNNLLENNDKNYIKYLENWVENTSTNITKLFNYYYYRLYKNLKTYDRFEYLTDKPYKKFLNISNVLFNRYFNSFEFKKVSSDKVKVIFVLNGLDYNQIVTQMYLQFIVNSANERFEYFILSLKTTKEFKNFEKTKEFLDKYNIKYFMPKEDNLEERTKEFYSFINKNIPDIAIFQSFYFAINSILIFPLLKNLNVKLGRFVHQQPEDFFDEKLDFVAIYGGLKDTIKNKTIFDAVWPLNTNLVNENNNIRKRFGIPKNQKILVSIARSIYFKDNKKFWDFIVKLVSEVPNLSFVAFGVSFDECSNLVPKDLVNNKKIIFGGFDAKASTYLKSCDFFLNTFPLGGGASLQEAFYAKLPIITFVSKTNNEDFYEFNYKIPKAYYKNAENIFPKFYNINELFEFSKKLILNTSFNDEIQKYRAFKPDELTYKKFISKFENFLIKLIQMEDKNV